jgi:hypothetical protein
MRNFNFAVRKNGKSKSDDDGMLSNSIWLAIVNENNQFDADYRRAAEQIFAFVLNSHSTFTSSNKL